MNKLGSCKIFALILGLCILLVSPALFAQEADSSRTNPRRMKLLAYGGAATYSSLLTGLNYLWYADHPQSKFHFFNDNRQWMQMDKAGHAYSAFHLSRIGSEAFLWAGMSWQKAAVYGSLSGWLFLLPIEFLDGFSPEYGASWGDLAANASGSLLYASQQLLWHEQRIKPKFSFHTTSFAPLRPNTLGHNLPTQILKDYNGQTYWLSVDIAKFLPASNKYPSWLNLAVGYGMEEMIYAHPELNTAIGHQPYKQFFIGPDLNLSGIKSRKKWVNTLLFILDGIHIPAPAVEFSKNGIRLHPLYF